LTSLKDKVIMDQILDPVVTMEMEGMETMVAITAMVMATRMHPAIVVVITTERIQKMGVKAIVVMERETQKGKMEGWDLCTPTMCAVK
jgi:hypothetical protein